MSIKQKLLGAFLCIATFVAMVGTFGGWGLLNVRHVMHQAAESSLLEIDNLNEASRNVVTIHAILDKVAETPQGNQAAELVAFDEQINSSFQTIASDLEKLVAESQRQLQAMTSADDRAHELVHLQALQDLQTTLTHWRGEWNASKARPIFGAGMDRDMDEAIHHMLRGLLEIEDQAQNDALDEVRASLADTRWIPIGFIFAAVATFIAALGIGGALSTSLARRLEHATAKTTELGKGNLAARIIDNHTDELSHLAQAFNTMAQSLSEALDAAQAANRAKSEFLANMSHEIRTPMTAILGYTDLMLDPDVSTPQRAEFVHTIRRNGEHLLNVINDILDLSKIEAGRMEIESLECSPCQIISEVAAIMRVRATGKNLPLNVDYVYPMPGIMRSDPLRLRQILLNLVGNAIKFTETGEIKLAVRSDGPMQPDAKIHFDVIDSGIGISHEVAERLFQPFSQADNSMARRFGGSGLGLTISRRLAEMMGGQIRLDSTPGMGSRFTLTLPLGVTGSVKMIRNAQEAILPSEPEGSSAEAPMQNCHGRILLAEDGPDNQRLIAHHLKKAGAEVTIAENGQIAVDAVAAAILAGKPFDLILMDMQMPVLDGYKATGLLRHNGYTGPIVALTAHAMAEDRSKCLAAGCSDYLSKPISAQRLISLVANCLHAKTTSSTPGARAA